MTDRPRRPGRPFPLGATPTADGTNFSLFSENATGVDLCLFGADGHEERIELRDQTAYHWHVELPGVGPGQRYGYRVHGPWEPHAGHRFNPNKLLVDPYARAIDGLVDEGAGRTLPYADGTGDDIDLTFDEHDDAAAIPRAVVVDPGFDWEGDRRLDHPFDRSVIYELHVKGFTAQHPDVREDLRGTYAGLASDAAIAHLVDLGVTAVELLPVHHIADEGFLHDKGLSNYWGYSTLGYFAPHSGYAATGSGGEQVDEFKGMVKALHRADIEVILDVVYNHTAEGNHLGPMLSFKGIDNVSYYRTVADDPRYYLDFTGTGNTLNVQHPSVLRLIMDSLRYWVVECHVDGFRFDLASTLARGLYDVGRLSSFFDVIHQDPVLSQVKLIAEPWDVGPGGYQVGNFPVLWAEWNGVYRDAVRDYWRGHVPVSELAMRISGSVDLYGDGGRQPSASVNFLTAHDGFTLADLVSYDHKHNDANLEDNQDGTNDNRSWNCGVEGPTDDPEVRALRARLQRSQLATLLVSQGVPMVLGGDELGRTQHGNNNAWCQDNEISWFAWELDDEDRTLLAFTKRLIHLRRSEPVLRRLSFLEGRPTTERGLPDAWWFRPDGRHMTRANWDDGSARALGVFLNGDAIPDHETDGTPIRGASLLLLFNGADVDVTFRMPARRFGRRWRTVFDTARPELGADLDEELASGTERVLTARSVMCLRRVHP